MITTDFSPFVKQGLLIIWRDEEKMSNKGISWRPGREVRTVLEFRFEIDVEYCAAKEEKHRLLGRQQLTTSYYMGRKIPRGGRSGGEKSGNVSGILPLPAGASLINQEGCGNKTLCG
jgi:hypothetical protein